MKNATYLFEQPSRLFKNSESRWTAMAQISFLYLSKSDLEEKLPVYSSDQEGYLTKEGLLQISGFKFNNTVCEQRLTGGIFEIDNFENKFNQICPDITKIELGQKKATIIEVKTLSESVVRNLELYTELKHYLASIQWECKLLYLLSHGHEKKKDWAALSNIQANIIIWEDLFSLMKSTPIAYLLGDSLHEYCAPPEKRTSPEI